MVVIVGNSTCKIEGMTREQFIELKKILKYDVSSNQLYYQGSHLRTSIPLIDKNGFFPTGLLYLIQINWPAAKILDRRKVPKKDQDLFSLKLPYIPYPEQTAAADAAKKYTRGIICAPTGSGKSAIAALIIDKLGVRTLLVVPSLELKRQLSVALSDMFGKDKVGPGKDICVENVDALDHKVVVKDYDCVIIDEFHHSGAKTYRKLNKNAWSKVYYKFGLTATPFRSQDNENIVLESVLSEVIYSLDYKTAVKNKMIVPMEAYYYELPRVQVSGHTWAEVYSELIVRNPFRNALIADIIDRLEDKSSLVLVKEIAHGETLAKLTGVHLVKGENLDNRLSILEFNLGHKKQLIGTTGVIGEGVDTKPAEYIIIAGLGKSRNAFMQQVGRGFRTFLNKNSCKIILFKDPSHKWTKNHFQEQVRVLKEEYGVVPMRLELPTLQFPAV